MCHSIHVEITRQLLSANSLLPRWGTRDRKQVVSTVWRRLLSTEPSQEPPFPFLEVVFITAAYVGRWVNIRGHRTTLGHWFFYLVEAGQGLSCSFCHAAYSKLAALQASRGFSCLCLPSYRTAGNTDACHSICLFYMDVDQVPVVRHSQVLLSTGPSCQHSL